MPPPPPDFVMLTVVGGGRLIVRTDSVDALRDANAQEAQAGAVAVAVVSGVQMLLTQELEDAASQLGFM